MDGVDQWMELINEWSCSMDGVNQWMELINEWS